ncbi:major capsid protein [Gordonia phage DumpTruck]|nr:major capsid protein [Gordonia phage DumpTruck]
MSKQLSLLLAPIFGAERRNGYLNEGDIVRTTIDGVDLNEMWQDFQDSVNIINEHLGHLVSLLTFPVTNPIETVPQVGATEFELASEFGIPRSRKIEVDYFHLGYDFEDYDGRIAYTWKFLRDADARQVEAVHQKNLEADGRLIFRKVMEAIFDNRNREADIRDRPYPVYPLYNADGTVPPSYKGVQFDGTHSHYLVSGAAALDSKDVEDMYDHIAEHGYGIENGTTFILFVNRQQLAAIRTWRRGVTNANGAVATYDYIPSPTRPAMFLPNAEGLLGSQPPAAWNGLPVDGSYGDILIIEEPMIPPNYLFMFGTGGAGDLQNVVGIREHESEAYRGLRLMPGNQARYPLVDSYYGRSFGTGVRQRAGAVVLQVKASGTYDIPDQYERGLGLTVGV